MPGSKEILNSSPEQVKLVDTQTQPRVSKELETWMQKVEKGGTTQTVVNDVNGQPLLTTMTPTNPKIVLPITRQKFIAGFKKKMDEAGRWLSTFILRLIKVKDGDVEFKKDK